MMNKNKSNADGGRTATPYTASKLESDLPRAALRAYSRYIHGAIDENMAMYGGFEAICRLSDQVTGKGQAFPVVAGDSGTYAIPTIAMQYRGLDQYILLGFCDLSADGKRVINPIPLPAWSEHSEYVKEMMKHALVTAS
jgi:hypothetical protein